MTQTTVMENESGRFRQAMAWLHTWLGLLSVAAVWWVYLLAYWPRFAAAKALLLACIGLLSCLILGLN